MPSADPKPRTLYDKVFQDHIVDEQDDGTILIYIGESPAAPHVSSPSTPAQHTNTPTPSPQTAT